VNQYRVELGRYHETGPGFWPRPPALGWAMGRQIEALQRHCHSLGLRLELVGPGARIAPPVLRAQG